MSNKTFKSAFIKGRTVRIDGNTNIGIHIAIDHGDDTCLSTSLSASDAPAIALAILEAAGIVPTAHDSYASTDHDRTLEDAAWEIRRIVNARARESEAAAKEAADREALEREAFTLYSGAPFTNGIKAFAALSEGAQHQWLTIARTARELHKAVS